MNEKTPSSRNDGVKPGHHIAPSKWRKRPVEIEAIRWDGDNLRSVIDFTGLHPSAEKWTWEEYEAVVRDKGLKIFTMEGPLMASVGDWIIKGVKGEFYPCKPDIFAATYISAAVSETQKRDPVMAMNEAIGRGLKHTFFQDGLAADLRDMKKEDAYVEGWRAAWLTMADDLQEIAK